MRRISGICVVFLSGLFVSTSTFAQATSGDQDKAGREVKNIVLIHGAWANGSSWGKLIPL